MAALAPMPSASVSSAANVNPGVRSSVRRAVPHVLDDGFDVQAFAASGGFGSPRGSKSGPAIGRLTVDEMVSVELVASKLVAPTVQVGPIVRGSVVSAQELA